MKWLILIKVANGTPLPIKSEKYISSNHAQSIYLMMSGLCHHSLQLSATGLLFYDELHIIIIACLDIAHHKFAEFPT